MPERLSHHHEICELLGVQPVASPGRQQVLAAREQACGVRFPEAVRDWFLVEAAECLFHENTNQDHLTNLAELGSPAETAQGYLCVATENQAVVAWYVRLDEGEDPPVYDNQDDWSEDLSSIPWQRVSRTFSNFLFDMIADNRFGGWYSGMYLTARDLLPDEEALGVLRKSFREGPTTDEPEVRVLRFYDPGGVVLVRSATAEEIAQGLAEWTIDAASPEALYRLARVVWSMGTLSRTLRPDGNNGFEAEKVLRRLRSEGRGG